MASARVSSHFNWPLLLFVTKVLVENLDAKTGLLNSWLPISRKFLHKNSTLYLKQCQ